MSLKRTVFGFQNPLGNGNNLRIIKTIIKVAKIKILQNFFRRQIWVNFYNKWFGFCFD